MSVPLKDIPGVMIEKIDLFDMPKGFDSLSKYKWNEALTQQGEVRVRLNPNKLEKLIHSITTNWYYLLERTDLLDDSIPPLHIYLTTEINQNLGSLIERGE